MNLNKLLGWWVIFITILHFPAAQTESFREIQASTDQFVKNRQGILSSFALNVTSKNVKITWPFLLSKDLMFTLRMRLLKFHFQMEPKCPSCCPENALYVPNNYQGHHVYCANSVFETLTALENNFMITFVSQRIAQGIKLEYSMRRKTEACSKLTFQCFDKRSCYNVNKICDGEFDCEDHSDEQNCLRCRTNYTMCNNEDRAIIPHKNCFNPELHRCDGILHCRTGEDEFNCVDECANQIQCADKMGCYTLEERCDGNFNCEDQSDEANCHSIKCDVLSSLSNYFACKNGWCIRKFKRHDGTRDCDDGSDEFQKPYTRNKLAPTVPTYVYIILSLSMLWMGIMWFGGMYQCCCLRRLRVQENQRKSSFIYNYEMEPCKRDAASQVSGPIPPPTPKRYLKPQSTITTSTPSTASTSAESLPLYEIIDSSTSIQSVTTVCKSYEDIPSQSLNVINHTINPSVAEHFPKMNRHANKLKISRNNMCNLSGCTPKRAERLKPFEYWI